MEWLSTTTTNFQKHISVFLICKRVESTRWLSVPQLDIKQSMPRNLKSIIATIAWWKQLWSHQQCPLHIQVPLMPPLPQLHQKDWELHSKNLSVEMLSLKLTLIMRRIPSGCRLILKPRSMQLILDNQLSFLSQKHKMSCLWISQKMLQCSSKLSNPCLRLSQIWEMILIASETAWWKKPLNFWIWS